MRKLFLILILAFVSSNAMAEWVRLDGDASSTVYSDPSRVIKNGSVVKLWSLINYKAPQVIGSGSYKSEMMQDEFNCKKEQARNIYHSFHSETMGRGNAIMPTFDVGGWMPVEPHSLTDSMMKLACGKK